MIHDIASDIVQAIIENLLDRKGFDYILDDLETDIRKELVSSLIEDVENSLLQFFNNDGSDFNAEMKKYLLGED